MEKKKLFLGTIIVSLMLVFSACNDDDDDQILEINFINNQNEATVASGASYTIAGTINSDAGLKTVKFFQVTNTGKSQLKLIDNFDNKNEYEFMHTINNITENATIEVEATDKDDQTTSKYFYLKVSSSINLTLKTFSITLGAQNNTTGSFLAAQAGNVYTITQVKDGRRYSDIDIIYYYGNENKNALFSPKSIVDNTITWNGSLPIANWGNSPNLTLFKQVTDNDYSSVTYESIETLGADANDQIAADLSTGDVYVFKTASGKYGILKVTSISGTDSGTINISYKIQE